MTLDMDALAAGFAADPRVVLAVLFGSAKNGAVRQDSDVDIGVLLSPALTPVAFYKFYVEMTAKLSSIAELDLIDLNHAGSILAFEALCGRRIFVRDNEIVAAFSSRVAREYEADMLHATAHLAA
ncbi:MAG: nucleotidyltransferase domain-containing protein [Kiritimatiellia bacterium]|jgi:predicted nucleotidyltransferase